MAMRLSDEPGPDDEALAISVLTWLAGEPEMMGRFLALSGLTADGLRTASAEPGFLSGVIAFVLNHEPTLIDFCTATETPPERVAAAGRRMAADTGSDGAQ